MSSAHRPPAQTLSATMGESFGPLLRRYRRAAGLSQAGLGASAGFSAVYIGMLERGARRATRLTVEALADGLTLSPADRSALLSTISPASTEYDGFLPWPLTSFVGRRKEVAVACDLLQDPGTRLLTLLGPGGVGKTRLAIEVSRRARFDAETQVIFVPLDRLVRPDAVGTAIVEALGLHPRAGLRPEQVVWEFIAGKRMLMVLDNFEHIVAAAVRVAEILTRCPRLQVLSTSRVVLGVSGERTISLAPLSCPRPAHGPDEPELPAGTRGQAEVVGSIAETDAVALFVERARAADPAFSITSKNAVDIGKICLRVDGLPLAIELAAAQTRHHSVSSVARQLARPLAVLTSGPRDVAERHQSLHAAFEWSYHILDERTREVFARFSVFRGGCTGVMAEKVCRAPGEQPIEAALSNLLDASLLQRADFRGVGERLTMLQTVREFGLEMLLGQGDSEAFHRRHLEVYREFAEEVEPRLRAAALPDLLRTYWTEHANILGALEWSLVHDPSEGLRLAAAASIYWEHQSLLPLGRQWLETLLAAGGEAGAQCGTGTGTIARAKALTRLANFAAVGGDFKAALRYGPQGLDLCRQIGDTQTLAWALKIAGATAVLTGDYPAAEAHFEEAVALAEATGDTTELLALTNNLGVTALSRDRNARAAELFDRSVKLGRRLGDERGLARGLSNLGFAKLKQREYAAARHLAEQSLSLRRAADDPRGICESLELLACAIATRDAPRSSLILGAARTLRQAHGLGAGPGIIKTAVEEAEARLRNMLGERQFEILQIQGAGMTLDQLAPAPTPSNSRTASAPSPSS